MATIAPCVWIPGRAEEAAAFYLAAFQRAGQPAEIRGRMRRRSLLSWRLLRPTGMDSDCEGAPASGASSSSPSSTIPR